METFDNTDWVLVYSTNEFYKAEILIEILEERGIVCQQIDKKDSTFAWGDIELYVMKDDVEIAQKLIEEHQDL
jgi:hypothetical protein